MSQNVGHLKNWIPVRDTARYILQILAQIFPQGRIDEDGTREPPGAWHHIVYTISTLQFIGPFETALFPSNAMKAVTWKFHFKVGSKVVAVEVWYNNILHDRDVFSSQHDTDALGWLFKLSAEVAPDGLCHVRTPV